jgi:hypothetical protein
MRPISEHAGDMKYTTQTLNNSGTPTGPVNTSLSSYKFSGSQYTESEGHPFYSSKKRGKADLGGPFYTAKREYSTPTHLDLEVEWQFTPTTRRRRTYTGPVLAVNPATAGLFTPPWPTESNDIELDALGATAIAQVSPTNPVVDLLTALTELRREGLPSLPASQTWRDRTLSARNAGSEYLNAQFGWLPLVSEVSGFTGVVTDAHAVVEQYRRGIGRPTRREFHFPEEVHTTESLVGTGRYPFVPSATGWWTPGNLYRSYTRTRRRWFSGCFTYYFPAEILGSRKMADLAILGKQLGLEPTPEVLWNVSPWTWAADWFSNTGDVIANWTSFNQDGLVMRYGYMMETTIIEARYSLVGCVPTFGGTHIPVSDVTITNTVKKRLKANPYGFGVSWDGLSSFQVSILAALGVTRV